MHNIWKTLASTGIAAAAVLGLSILAAPEVSADSSAAADTAPPLVATAPTQLDNTASGWIKNEDDTFSYYGADGEKYTGIREIDDVSYLFSDSGILMTGWQTIDGKRFYYSKEDGQPQFGWLNWNGSRYYIDPENGKQNGWLTLEADSTEQHYFLDDNGVLQTGFFQTAEGSPLFYAGADGAIFQDGIYEIDGAPYWFHEDGSLHTGWQTVNGKRYFYDPITGEITFGWIHWNDNYYYVSAETGKYTGAQEADEDYYPFSPESGAVQEGMCQLPDGSTRFYYKDGSYHRGWFYDSTGAAYYFDDSTGAMCTGWKRVENKTYYFQENGTALSGWLKENGKIYYFNKSAQMCTGWQTIDGKRYCFLSDGSAVTGWQTDSKGSSYYFLEDGSVATGWLDIGNHTYYFRSDGTVTRGIAEIDGKSYLFADDSGVLQKNVTQNGITTDANGVIVKRILSVQYLSQAGFPTGCESAAAVMLLHQAGYNTSLADFVDKYLDKGSFYWKNGVYYGPDPSTKFVGDPRSSSGFGCYAPVITNALNKILTNGDTAKNITGTPFSSLLTDYIDHGIPVAVWASINMMQIDNGRQWTVPETGALFTWKRHEHCLVLVGYDSQYYYMNDPYQSKGLVAYQRSVVEARYATMGYQAVVIQ